jgi:translocation protein SEC66
MAALLLRASEDVRRIHRLRVSKQALAALIQSGGLNEDVQARFAAAEKEMEAEVVDVVSEANSYRQGWGQWVFASASEMVGRDKIKDVLSGIDKVRMEEGQSQVHVPVVSEHLDEGILILRFR